MKIYIFLKIKEFYRVGPYIYFSLMLNALIVDLGAHFFYSIVWLSSYLRL